MRDPLVPNAWAVEQRGRGTKKSPSAQFQIVQIQRSKQKHARKSG